MSGDDGTLNQALELATSLVAQVRAFASAFDFGDLDLPAVVSTPADQARLRAVAPLYFASELESARLLPALDMLAGIYATGGLPADLGPMGETLVRYHRERNSRLTAEERDALFGRLFGKPYGPALAVDNSRNLGFDALLTDLAAALSDWDSNAAQWGGSAADAVRVRASATQLAANLAARAGGVASFAAGEIMRDITLAVAVFKEPAVLHALGAIGMWQGVQLVAQRFMQQRVDVASHVERAKAGLVLLAWLADALPALEAGNAELPPPETIMHAVRWMQATLALHEQAQPTAPSYLAA